MKLIDLLRENAAQVEANERIDSLPQGKVFDDAKRIDGIFNKSKREYSYAQAALEQNRENAKKTAVNTTDIRITQPNVQSGKVKEKVEQMIEDPKDVKTIDAVQFPDGEMVIPDGHHRLTANWALGNKTIVVNLIKAQEK